MVYGARSASAAQEHGKHAVIAAMSRTAEHTTVTLLKIINIPSVFYTAPTAEVRFDQKVQPPFVRRAVPCVRCQFVVSTPDHDVALHGLVSALENNGIIFRFFAVDDDLFIIAVAIVGALGRFDVVLPLKRHRRREGYSTGGVP